MATNYPGAVDSLTNPGTGDALDSPSHAGQHANANDAIEAVQTELGTDPSGASATVKARFEVIEANDWVTSARIADGAVTAAKILIGAATVGSGTGSPEGVVVAAPGSTWLQTDSTTDVKGWIRWVKATGTGSIGWVAGPEADTGWRNVTLLNGWTGTLQIRRLGNIVHLLCDALSSTGASDDVLYAAPSGFRYHSVAIFPWGNAGAEALLSRVNGNVDSSTRAGSLYAAVSWPTGNAWPSSLPGSAA